MIILYLGQWFTKHLELHCDLISQYSHSTLEEEKDEIV